MSSILTTVVAAQKTGAWKEGRMEWFTCVDQKGGVLILHCRVVQSSASEMVQRASKAFNQFQSLMAKPRSQFGGPWNCDPEVAVNVGQCDFQWEPLQRDTAGEESDISGIP